MGISSSVDPEGQVKKKFLVLSSFFFVRRPRRTSKTHPSKKNSCSLFHSSSFPFNYRYVANGHRASATARPLAWDAAPRTCTGTPEDAKT